MDEKRSERHRILRDLQAKLEHFATRERFHGDFDKAFSLFFSGPAQIEPPESGSMEQRRFLDWLIHDFRLDHGHRLVDLFEMEHGAALSPASRHLLRRWRSATRTVLQVVETPEPRSFRARDLVSGSLLTISYAEREPALTRWSVVIGRPISVDLHHWELPQILAVLPPRALRPLVQRLRGELRILWHEHPGIDLQEGLRRMGVIFEELIRAVEATPDPAFRTPEGDPVDPGRAVYTGEGDANEFVELLQRMGVLAPSATGGYTLFADPRRTLPLGELSVAQQGERCFRIKIRCLSAERLKKAKQLIARHLPAPLVHRFDVLPHPAACVPHADDEGKGEARPLPYPVRRQSALWQATTEQYYSRWADLPLSGRGVKTPRALASRPEGRMIVEEALQSFEYVEARKKEAGLPCASLDDLRRELGLGEGRRPQYPPLRQKLPRWYHPSHVAVARRIKALMNRLRCTSLQIHAAGWLWYDYCLVDPLNVRNVNAWAAAVVRALAEVERWRDERMRAIEAGEEPRAVRDRARRIRRALDLREYDRRYAVVVPEMSLVSSHERPADPAIDVAEAELLEALERMFALRQRVEAQARSMSALMSRAWDLFLSNVPAAGHDRLWGECFLDWFLFDWPIPVKGGSRAIELCYQTASRNGEYSAADLEKWQGRHPYFCRIEAVPEESKSGNGSTIRLVDLVDPEQRFEILWPHACHRVRAGDVMLVRPAPVAGVWLCIGQSLYFSAQQAEAIRCSLEDEKRLVERWHGREMSWEEFRSRHAERLYGIAYRLVEDVQEL